jgi:hypothetical protein
VKSAAAAAAVAVRLAADADLRVGSPSFGQAGFILRLPNSALILGCSSDEKWPE